jgi:uncharacterized protein (TIGR03437 family)
MTNSVVEHFRRNHLLWLFLLTLSAVSFISFKLIAPQTATPTTNAGIAQKPVSKALGSLSLSFEANHGQSEGLADFLAHGPGYSLSLTATEATLLLQPIKATRHQREAQAANCLRMQLIGANPTARARGVTTLPGHSNYLLGRDPKRWRTGIEQFRQARYDGIYPGIDVVYYGTQGQLEYDFIVAPHADPQAIKLSFAGADQVEINAEGELVLRLAGADVRQGKPVIYQEVDGKRQVIAGGYVQTGEHEIGFDLTTYDRERPLVIDPVILYASFLGGSSQEDGLKIALDVAGNIYVMGKTTSTNFPVTAQAFKRTSVAQQDDVFISKLNPTGTALIYSTYLGSNSGNDVAADFVVDAAGNVFLAGNTSAANFPVTPNAAQTSFAGSNEAFVAKLNATGSALLYSTLLGGNSFDNALDISLDAAGNFYVTGQSFSSDFPTTAGALQKAPGTPQGNAFIAKFTASGTIAYATYYGGNNPNYSSAIATDTLGNAFVAGDEGGNKIFVLKLNPSGSQLLFNFTATTTGGNILNATDLLLDNSGNLYVTGYTTGGLAATPGAYQLMPRGRVDAYVLKLNAAGGLTYLSYLGGSESDSGSSLALDNAGNIYVVGWTISTDFPTLDAPQSRYRGGGLPFGDGFITKLNASGSALLYSTYLGTPGNDYVNDIAVDSVGNAYVVGGTLRPTFPVTPDAVQISSGGLADAFVAKLGEGAAALTNVSAASYLRDVIAPEAIVAAFGPALSLGTQAAGTTPLPTSLAGTSVMVRDNAGVERLAPLFFVSPNQINYQIPPGTIPGTARVGVRNANGVQSDSITFVERVAPALFTANASGQGVPAALVLRVKTNGMQSYEAVAVFDTATSRFVPRPLDFGQDELFLILFGSGLRFRNQLSDVQVLLQGNLAPALYAGAQGSLVGLDQVNVHLPKTLAGRGETSVIVWVEGNGSNEVRVSFK